MIVAGIVSTWPAARGLDGTRTARTPATVLRDTVTAAPWTPPAPRDSAKSAPWGMSAQQDRANASPWGIYARRTITPAISAWGIATATDHAADAAWGQYAHHYTRRSLVPWGVANVADQAAAVPWGQYAGHLGTLRIAVAPASRQADYDCPSPWGHYQQRLALGVAAPTEPGFVTVIIPIQRSYLVINDVVLTRVSDNLELPALALSLSIDADSWVWAFSATLPGAALADVVGDAGAPVELSAWINGTEFRLLAERVSRTRSFAKAGVSISGRGIAAVLDAPYAALASHYSAPALTAQQAAEAAITASELPVGWSLDWQITDWLLPAGLWAHQGSPMSAVNRIAAAAGAYVQADPLAKILHILPRYPTAPWAWAGVTPDIEIPSAVAVTEGIEWADKPDHDVVYISGETGGILARVKRTGSAGILPATMATDTLITHPDAARQRGLSILADTGRQAKISLSMPVLEASGIIQPGALVRYIDGAVTRLGLARSVAINATLPTVRQTVEIETHE